jgi:hypothetical protein
MKRIIFVVIVFILLSACHGKDPQPTPAPTIGIAVLSWNPGTTYTDGSLMTPAGYKLYSGTAHGTYTDILTIAAADVRTVNSKPTYTYSALSLGKTYYFAVTVYDGDNTESTLSTEVNKAL